MSVGRSKRKSLQETQAVPHRVMSAALAVHDREFPAAYAAAG